jgi:hypothetical protein
VGVAPQTAFRRRHLDEVQELARAAERIRARHRPMTQQGLDDLVADGEHGIERGERFLEDHGDHRPPQLLPLGLGQPIDVAPGEEDFATHARPPGRVQAEDRAKRDALARARLAQQRQDLSPLEREGDAAERVHGALPRRELDVKISEDQQGHRRHGVVVSRLGARTTAPRAGAFGAAVLGRA